MSAAHPSAKNPRPAATVLLVRDGERGLEVFMEKRHIQSDFVGGAYVFPGGGVDSEDAFAEPLCRGLEDSEASRRLGLESGGLAFFVAAIRECFEEAGVLLAYDRHGELLDFDDAELDARFQGHRALLNQGTLELAEMARQEGLLLATDRMHYWSHWLTPGGQPRRYDTRFFIAEAPNQAAVHDEHELVNSAWVAPAEAVERARRREWMMIFPTIKTLQKLGEFADCKTALGWALSERTIPCNQPKLWNNRVVLPGDEGYERAPEEVANLDPKIWEVAAFL